MKLRIATWNINSIRLREGQVCRLLKEFAPDILCLQETKSITEEIPKENFYSLGYKYQVFRGQKSYNGVAIISRLPIKDLGHHNFCSKSDARHLRVSLTNDIVIENFYVPAGGDIADRTVNEKFGHKLDFLKEMRGNFTKVRPTKTIVVGDLNIAPLEHDVWSHKQLINVVSHTAIEIEFLNAVIEAGEFVDIIRKDIPEGKLYSWWSYRSPNWEISDRGRRLDHILATKDIVSKEHSSFILKQTRSWERPSDHVPVFAEFHV